MCVFVVCSCISRGLFTRCLSSYSHSLSFIFSSLFQEHFRLIRQKWVYFQLFYCFFFYFLFFIHVIHYLFFRSVSMLAIVTQLKSIFGFSFCFPFIRLGYKFKGKNMSTPNYGTMEWRIVSYKFDDKKVLKLCIQGNVSYLGSYIFWIFVSQSDVYGIYQIDIIFV